MVVGDCEEGGLGKPLPGQKRDRDDEILKRYMAVRSGARALKKGDKSMQAKPAHISASEGAEMHGTATLKNPHEGVYYPALGCVCNTEACVESDPLGKMFLDWAEKKNKTYESAEEQKFRFKIWCSTKKMIENAFSNNKPGYTASINNMSSIADRTLPEQKKMSGSSFIGEGPFKGPPPQRVVKYVDSLGEEGVKKVWKEFDEWAEGHKRDYGGSSEERTLRFHAYAYNKRSIDEQEEKYPGFWTHGYDLDNMDKFAWEARLRPESNVAQCVRCGL